MWILTPTGFYSIVEKENDKLAKTLTIRARAKADLENLREAFLPELGVIKSSSSTDYRYRAQAPRDAVTAAFAKAIQGLDYSNFKDAVATRQGPERAKLYHDVWAVLYKLQGSKYDPVGPDRQNVDRSIMRPPIASAYGGIVIDKKGRVLLREPKNHFDGYVWTFPKGRPNKGESPQDAALREVLEETGCKAEITDLIDGVFKGGTTTNVYFIMNQIHCDGPIDAETNSIRWVSFIEAQELISKTTNAIGKARDLAVLHAAAEMIGRNND